MADAKQIAVFGGGCFWCTEAVFQRLRGVESVTSGYAGGSMDKPDYEAVSSGKSGHAEVIRVEFDPQQIKYTDLLNVFFATHDPTTLNQQGNDVGTQYRSVIFYTTEQQKAETEKYIHEYIQNIFDSPITTDLKSLDKFFPAEDYHQEYYNNNPNKPYCQLVIDPKVAKLRQKFAPFLRE